MTWLQWLREDWFTALQTLAILSGFLFTCITLRRDQRSRRVANLLLLTANHRDVWNRLFSHPELRRILSPHADLATKPVTDDETLFVSFLVLHLNSAFQAIKSGLLEAPEGLAADIRTFFAHPIPRAVWASLRPLQDRAFVAFVEKHTDETDSH